MEKPFAELFGQINVKKRLNFYLKAFDKTSLCPFLLLVGAKGLGKTEFARQFGSNLKNRDGKNRPFLEMNCSTIKNLEGFFDQIFIPLVMDSEITVLFDEAHELPKDVTNAFLTIFNTERSNTRNFRWRDGEYPFDFQKQTFLFATTEPDKLFPPLKDRLTAVDFEDYEPFELAQILEAQVEDIAFEEEALLELAKTSRGNARDCVKVAKELRGWCAAFDKKIFRMDDFENFCEALAINPLGVSHIEKKVLSILRREGQASLQELCAKTGLSRTAIQRDVELYLMKKSLIKIDGKRHITKQGSDYIDHHVKRKTA
jgi:Holliday junction DNA helicase RuvB